MRPGENSKGFITVSKPTERRPFFLGASWTFVCQAAPHTTPHTPHNTTTHNTTRRQRDTETETDRNRERDREKRQKQRETERDRERETRQEKTRQDKKREDETLDPGEVLWDTGAQEGLVGKQQFDKWCKLILRFFGPRELNQNGFSGAQ